MPEPADHLTDTEPIVILDDDGPVVVGPGILDQITAAGIAHLATDIAAQEQLRAAGITDPATWAAFRLGSLPTAYGDGLDAAAWSACARLNLIAKGRRLRICGPGLTLPTVDPREPSRVLGLVRLNADKSASHGFVTPPAGIAATPGLDAHPRVVLVDAPWLALRLHQAGVTGIALVEEPTVLVPLLPWLATRTVVLASSKHHRLETLRAVLGELGAQATAIQVQPDIQNSSTSALEVLGLVAPAKRPALGLRAAEAPTLSAVELRELHAFAVDRLISPEAHTALAAIDAGNLVAFRDAYRPGWCPPTMREALPTAAATALADVPIAGAIVLPAYDQQGAIVDLAIIRPEHPALSLSGLWDVPRGLLAPAIATSASAIIVTDRIAVLVRLLRSGYANVLLVRGLADLRANAERLAASGVRAVELRLSGHADTAAEVLRAVGIIARVEKPRAVDAPVAVAVDAPVAVPEVALNVVSTAPPIVAVPEVAAAPILFPVLPAAAPLALVPPAPPQPAPEPSSITPSTVDGGEPLELVDHDRQVDLATFRSGATTYVVEVPWEAISRLEVTIRHAGLVHRERCDLASAAQRGRFASCCVAMPGLTANRVTAHLVALLDAVRELQRAAITAPSGRRAAPSVTGAAYDAAMAMLRSPDLLHRIAADLEQLGWVGEDEAKRLLYLVGISRKLDDPLWALLNATPGAGKSFGQSIITATTPPEDVVQVSRITDAALYYQDPDALRHALLTIDESDVLTPEVLVTLRVLKTRGALSIAHAQRAGTGVRRSAQVVEAHGPVALITGTAGTLEPQLLSRCCTVAVDESPDQTARILAAQRRRCADPAAKLAAVERQAIISRHHDLQRLLLIRPVVIPFAERITFPAVAVHHRRDHERFLALIEASALLYQHQRLTDRGCIVADERDFDLAVRLAPAAGIGGDGSLSRPAQQLWETLWRAKAVSFTMDDLTRLLPHWTRYAFRAALAELLALELVSSPSSGRGKLRTYHLMGGGAGASFTAPLGISLTKRPEVGGCDERHPGLASVGDVDMANETPVPATG